MDLKEQGDFDAEGANLIGGYGDFGFRVRGAFHKSSIVVDADGLTLIDAAALGDLTVDHFLHLFEGDKMPEIILVGTGKNIAALPKSLAKGLLAKGIEVDFMDTGAAARTYNILVLEKRYVGAVLVAHE
jgi:uncharacterized protein